MMRPAPPFRIPGPAGVLPSQATPAPTTPSPAAESRPSQSHATFASRTWRAMLHARHGQALRSSLALLRRNALMSCRAPLDDLPVLVERMDPIGDDLSFLLVDPTQSVHASISHSSLDVSLRAQLRRGAVLVLKDVSNTLLLQGESKFARGHSQDVHLIIHRSNIKSVFSISDDLPVVDMPPCNSSSQLKKWALQPYSQYAAQPPPVPNVRVPLYVPTSYRLPRPSSHSAPRPSTPTAHVQNTPRPILSAHNPLRLNHSSRGVQKPFHLPRRCLHPQVPAPRIPNPTIARTSRTNVLLTDTVPSNHAANLVSETDFEAILGNLDVDAIVQAKRKTHTVQNPPTTSSVVPHESHTRPSFTNPDPTLSNLCASPHPAIPSPSQHTSTQTGQPQSHPTQPQSTSVKATVPSKPNLSALDQQTIDDLFD